MAGNIISISVPPFPDFIEGNYRIMKKGQSHVERRNLGYFDLIVVKKGCLFLAEEEQQYEIRENEMFILLPTDTIMDGNRAKKIPDFTGCIFIQLRNGNRAIPEQYLFQSFQYRNCIFISVPIPCIYRSIHQSKNRNLCLNYFRKYWTVPCRMISGRQNGYF